ncbi:MetQ/NlpA family ABC transporter substrate-binding protein [Leuconostoc mesenteroides]|uniref:MetQ/NlpA family ABC transporter substrate-binding protein n=1 Tax=Leuconostoc mesenteroides TaxID=1245 RepID=UPI003C592EF1
MKNKKNKFLIGTLGLIVVVIISFFSFKKNDSTENHTITIGIMSGTKDDDEFWNLVKDNASQKYGVQVVYKKFTDYNTPNKALQSGDLDANAFQNIAFLKSWNKSHNTNIVSIGKTMIAPMNIYSEKIANIKSIKSNSTIGIPNDTANEERALLILKNAGLIKLKKSVNLTPKDVIYNPKKIQFKEVSAEQIPHALDSLDAGIINTNYAKAAGLDSSKSIYTERINKDSEKYASVVATTDKLKKNKLVNDYLKAYQSENVKKEMKKIYGETKIPAWDLNFNKNN